MRKVLSILTSALMVASMGLASAPVMAENAGLTYTPVAGTSTQFNKYLIVEEHATTPTVTFSYTIAPGASIAAGNGTFAVTTGEDTGTNSPVSGAPTIGTAAFSPADSHSATVASGDVVTLEAGEEYVKKVVTIDFSTVSFKEPGVYRWLVTEQEVAGRTDILYDTQDTTTPVAKQRVLDVYVTDNGSGQLAVSQYVFHSSVSTPVANSTNGTADVQADADALADKSTGYVNEWLTADVEFGKEVTGNQGSKDKYFDFTLVLTGCQAAHTYTVNIEGAQATTGTNPATISANSNKQNPATITVDANGAATTHYYLKDGQYIKVYGLPVGASYTLTENAEDYKSTEAIATSVAQYGGIDHTDPVSHAIVAPATGGTAAMKDYYTGFTNTRNGVIPTGIAVGAAGAIAISGLAIAGLLAKKRKEDEE